MLKATYDSKDAIPQGFDTLYAEKDGKFVLTGIEGVKTQEDVDNVKNALQRERELKRELQAKVEAYGDVQPDGLRDQLDELARLRTTNGKVDDKNIEEIVAERLKLDKSAHERELEKIQAERDQALEEKKHLVNEKNGNLIERKLREAANGKVSETAMNDVLFRASLFEVSEDGNVLTRDGIGVTPGQAPEKWLEESLEKNVHWQNKSVGAGAKGNVGSNASVPKTGAKSIADAVAEQVQFN